MNLEQYLYTLIQMQNLIKPLRRLIKQQEKINNPMSDVMKELKKETSHTGGEKRNYGASEMTSMIQKALAGKLPDAIMQQYVTKNTNERIDSFGVIADATRSLETCLVKMSKNSKKKLFNLAGNLSRKMTISRLNKFLKTLHKLQGESYKLTLIDVSLKEQEIDKARIVYGQELAAFRAAEAKFKTAKSAFLTTKGNFYKKANIGQ